MQTADTTAIEPCATPLTNAERRDDILFLLHAYRSSGRGAPQILDESERRRFRAGDAGTQRRLFFRLLCYGALAAQPAPEAVVLADWHRLTAAGVVEQVFDRAFDVYRFAVAPPVSRSDSRGRVVDFIRLSQARELWAGLLPQPGDDAEVIDVLYACSGGALKSRAFWVTREMLRLGLWPANGLRRSACVPDGRVRKRASRIGLVDLPEHAETLDDMKAVSAALHAVLGLAGDEARGLYDLPLSGAAQRCEVCDRRRMASCPMPHCRFRRVTLAE